MYRILLADDEGIMLESLKTAIESNFQKECEIACAKTGRAVIELAESFRPDIAFMDIQMPGINGIEAMKEIRKFSATTKFIVISAYEKFSYAREAINLGVVEYLTKPVNRKTVIEVLVSAMRQVDRERDKRRADLAIREKLETVVPLVESGLINTLLLQDALAEDADHYRQLLDIEEDFGFVILLQFGEKGDDGFEKNAVGMSVKAQGFYGKLREMVKAYFRCVVGPVMGNKTVVYVPWKNERIEFEERTEIIERSRSLVHDLEKQIDARFRSGIGSVRPLLDMKLSYGEALRAMEVGKSRRSVAHIKDMPIVTEYTDDYPGELERKLVAAVENADIAASRAMAGEFFGWMCTKGGNSREEIQLKVLELVMWVEREAFFKGGMDYGFQARKGYLTEVLAVQDAAELEDWFIRRLLAVCKQLALQPRQQTQSTVTKAKGYIDAHFQKDISLDEVSKTVDISPYYFSKLFKEETGENFIEYLTRVRIENAKKLLRAPGSSIKEVCLASGYADPNYFSRIFKKQVGVTPSEYREKSSLRTESDSTGKSGFPQDVGAGTADPDKEVSCE